MIKETKRRLSELIVMESRGEENFKNEGLINNMKLQRESTATFF
jgi:hypothetical protein